MGREIFSSGFSFRRVSRVGAPDQRDAGKPCIVEFRGGFMEVARFGKVANSQDEVDIGVIMPPVGAADFQIHSGFPPEAGCKVWIRQFGQEIRGVSEKCRGFQSVSALWVSWNQVGLRPVRHEHGSGEAPGMRGILDDLKMGAGVREKVRDDGGDELRGGRPESLRQEIAQGDDDSRSGKFRDKRAFAESAEFRPGLIEPRLC